MEILNQLILDYLTSEINPGYDTTSSNPLESWIEYKYTIIGKHTQWGDAVQTLINHSGEEFLSWHREYITGLEQYLLDRGFPQYVPLPYWNPNEPLPNTFYNSMIAEYEVEGIDSTNHPSQDPGDPYFFAPRDKTWIGDISIDDDLCADFADAAELGQALVQDATHTSVHFEMGGAYTSQAATSGTTAFWLHHANFDRFYRCYQIECECPELEVATYTDQCDYCFDFSASAKLSSNGMQVILVDQSGVEQEISLNEQGCIPYGSLTPGDSYEIHIEAIKNGKQNIDCPLNRQSLQFTAPNPTPTKFDSNPCLKLEALPKFPIPMLMEAVLNGIVEVTNTGESRIVDFVNTTAQNGETHTLISGLLLEAGQTIEVEIPISTIGQGINVFSTIVGDEESHFQYLAY